MSARVDADAVRTKCSVPLGKRRTNRQGKAIAVATVRPETPPNHVAAQSAIDAVVKDQSGISISIT
jgi:hypothetical protein